MNTKKGVVFFGSNPTDDELLELKNAQITMVWNLGEELSIEAELEREFAEVVYSPIEDGQAPLDRAQFILDLAEVCKHVKSGGKVFVHCLQGKGRTGIALACLVYILDGASVGGALQIAKRYCGGPEKSKQKSFVISVLSELSP